jgi:GT2 family glycosyltransferase
MDKVGIIVLNYLNYNDTIECVNSLLDINYDNYDIIVVDNGSNNSSFEILKDNFVNERKVYVINTGKNLGYARGNNFGIDYCRKELDVDHVMIINNDTIVEDKEIINIFLKYKGEGILLGPKIINLDGNNQNPIGYFSKKLIMNKILYFFLSPINLYKVFRNIYDKISNKKKDENKHNKQKNIILHGSCIFFTNEFFKYYRGFFNRTFLYFEEVILYILIKKIEKKVLYVSETYIIHKEDGSSSLSFNNKQLIKDKYEFFSFMWFLLLYILPYSLIKRLFN